VGDGALMFSVQELMTAVEQRLALPIVCVDSGGYAEIRQNMLDAGIAPVSVDLVQPDWPALARAMGARGVHVAPAGLAGAVSAALAADGPTIIHVLAP